MAFPMAIAWPLPSPEYRPQIRSGLLSEGVSGTSKMSKELTENILIICSIASVTVEIKGNAP